MLYSVQFVYCKNIVTILLNVSLQILPRVSLDFFVISFKGTCKWKDRRFEILLLLFFFSSFKLRLFKGSRKTMVRVASAIEIFFILVLALGS